MNCGNTCGLYSFPCYLCRWLPVLVFFAASVLTHAADSPLTLKQRVEACDSVLVISITKVAPPGPLTNGVSIGQARVVEVLKGSPPPKQISFWFASHGQFAGPASKVASGKDYVAFMCHVNGKFWAFEGAVGLEPVSSDYQVKRLEDGKIITETLSHTNYLNAIRSFVQPIKVSISQLLKDRRKYFGKRVEVTGYYHSHFEYSGLYEKKEDMDRFVENPAIFGANHNGLWVTPISKPGFDHKLHFVDAGHVRVIGVFSYNSGQPDLGAGHLNGWPAELISLELFEPVQ